MKEIVSVLLPEKLIKTALKHSEPKKRFARLVISENDRIYTDVKADRIKAVYIRKNSFGLFSPELSAKLIKKENGTLIRYRFVRNLPFSVFLLINCAAGLFTAVYLCPDDIILSAASLVFAAATFLPLVLFSARAKEKLLGIFSGNGSDNTE